MKIAIKGILPLFLMAIFSVSCGSSGDGTVASGGIGGTGISQGTITKLGSVTVNGVKFNTDSATFTIDDNPNGVFTDLKEGMVVKVDIDDSGTKATKVEFEAEVEGPVDSIDTATNSLVVLGRTVIVDDSTKFEGTTGLSGLSDGDRVEVSGLVFADTKIQATYIKKDSSATELELKGTVDALDTTLKTFTIGSQQVSYTGTINFEKMTEADLKNGLLVEVKGTRGAAGTSMTATTIQKEDGTLGANENNKVEIEGLVTTFLSSSAFSINGQAVSTNTSTLFEDGAADDIEANVRLEVEGTITAGVLVAKKVKFHGNRIKIEANVERINLAANTVTLFGNAVVINGVTEMKDKDSGETLVFSDIKEGDRLEIRGYLSGGVVTATRVERNDKDKDKDIRLQAPVEAVANPNLTLLGVAVDTTGVLDTDFEDRNDQFLGRTAFFNLVKIGDLVKVKGTLTITGTVFTITAEEVEFED